jgi:hypothetical protein
MGDRLDARESSVGWVECIVGSMDPILHPRRRGIEESLAGGYRPLFGWIERVDVGCRTVFGARDVSDIGSIR